MVVKRIKEGSGADMAAGKVGPGDRLLEIDGVVITGLGTSALAKLVLGKENTKARLKVQKAAPSREVLEIEVPRLARRDIDDNGSIDSMSSITSQVPPPP